ncbi:MAG: hypothetical protein R6X16_13055 [Anaerolineae bacterium]
MSPRKRFAFPEQELVRPGRATVTPAAAASRVVQRTPRAHGTQPSATQLIALQRTGGNRAVRRLLAQTNPTASDATDPALVRRQSATDETDASQGIALPENGAEIPEVQISEAAKVAEMIGDINDFLGLGLDIADLAGASFLESAAVTAAAGLASLLGQVLFIIQAVSAWIDAWSESDKKVAILGSCAGIVATAKGEDAPQPPQGRWLGTPQDRDRWSGVWWRSARDGKDWVRSSLDLLAYTRRRLREGGAMGEMLAGAAEHLTGEFQGDFQRQLPQVLALLLSARQRPDEVLNALYEPLAREHLMRGAANERYTWPP